MPPIADMFAATPLYASDWLLVAVIALVPAVVAEVYRAVRHRPWVA
jgi:hypothetical protein